MPFKNMLKKLFYLTLVTAFLAVSGQAQTTAEEFLKRGIARRENKQYLEAQKDFEKAVELAPQMAEAYFWRAESQLDDEKAFADYAKAIALKPDYAMAYYKRGLKKSFTDNKAALIDYNKAIELDPKIPDAFLARALVFLLAGNYKPAIADYTKLIELKPDGESYYVRGTAYLDSGDNQRAVADYTKSIALDPNYYWTYKQRAKAYRSLRKFKEAGADEAKAIQIGPPKVD